MARIIARRIMEWFGERGRDLPWRRTSDAYAIWVSEIMLQQTQVKTVIPYWERWMAAFPTVEALAGAPEEAVLKAWEGLGYYSRARNLRKAARWICEERRGEFPRTRDEILELPGVGPYTAGAIASLAFGEAAAILDGNAIRVLSRLFLVEGDPKSAAVREELWKMSRKLVEAAGQHPTGAGKGRFKPAAAFNQGLMEIGALVCAPRAPRCPECPVKRQCGAYRARRVLEFPQAVPRAKARARLFIAYVIEGERGVLVRRRPEGEVNAGLWEFPNFEPVRGSSARRQAREWLGFDPGSGRVWMKLKHSITTSRITLKTYRGAVNGEAALAAGRLGSEWMPLAGIRGLPFTGAHAKIRERLLHG